MTHSFGGPGRGRGPQEISICIGGKKEDKMDLLAPRGPSHAGGGIFCGENYKGRIYVGGIGLKEKKTWGGGANGGNKLVRSHRIRPVNLKGTGDPWAAPARKKTPVGEGLVEKTGEGSLEANDHRGVVLRKEWPGKPVARGKPRGIHSWGKNSKWPRLAATTAVAGIGSGKTRG